jgi:hypothetical protein
MASMKFQPIIFTCDGLQIFVLGQQRNVIVSFGFCWPFFGMTKYLNANNEVFSLYISYS